MYKKKLRNLGNTPIEIVDKLYNKYLESQKVVTDLSLVDEGCIYFSLSAYQPNSRAKRLIWNFLGLVELYAPNIFGAVVKIFIKVFRGSRISSSLDFIERRKINGNSLAPYALKKGASLVVVDIKKFNDPKYVVVPSVRMALLDLIKKNKGNCKCVSITGTCGKTTTKDLVSSVLQKELNIVKTPGNCNTEYGVLDSVFEIKLATQVAVIEIGSAGGASIGSIVEIAQPDFALITNIGKAHLEGFGDIDGVIKMKRQLFDYIVEHKGFFFANIDDPNIVKIVGDYPSIWTYGQDPSAYIRGEAIENSPFLKVRWHLPQNLQDQIGQTFLDIQTHLFGVYNLSNVLAAIAVGAYLGISVDNIRHGIESYIPQNHRSQILPIGDITFIMDAYNANPTSMNAALDDFANLEAPKKIAILGDMLELGHHSLEEHKLVIDKLTAMNFDAVYFVGKEFGRAGADKVGQNFPSAAQLADFLSHDALRHAHVLVKGSRGIGLETILKRFDYPLGEDDA